MRFLPLLSQRGFGWLGEAKVWEYDYPYLGGKMIQFVIFPVLGILCGAPLVSAGKTAAWQLIDSSALNCLDIFVFCDIEEKTRKGMEATEKCQKIRKSMGRRNAICLPGCSCSFPFGQKSARGVWVRHPSRVASRPGSPAPARGRVSQSRRVPRPPRAPARRAPPARPAPPRPPWINNQINKSFSSQAIQTKFWVLRLCVHLWPFPDAPGSAQQMGRGIYSWTFSFSGRGRTLDVFIIYVFHFGSGEKWVKSEMGGN